MALPLDYLLSETGVFPAEFSGFARYGTAAVVALGILASVGEFYRRRRKVGLRGWLLSYVGRMALSCYLLENVLGVLAQYTVVRLQWTRGAVVLLDGTDGGVEGARVEHAAVDGEQVPGDPAGMVGEQE